MWAHYLTHHNYNQQTKCKEKKLNNEMVLFSLTSVQLCVIGRVTTQMGALDDFCVALLHFADFLNRSNCLRRGEEALFTFKTSKSDFLSAQRT